MSREENFQPLPFNERLMIGPSPVFEQLLAQHGLSSAEYRGTDIKTADEYWQLADPPIAFVASSQPVQRIIVWSIGSDPDAT